MASIISALQTYIKAYSELKKNAPVWVDYLGAIPVQYSIIPIAGIQIIETYINGASLREYPFAFQSAESTADEATRLANLEFYEAFSAWLETQTDAGTLPELTAPQVATEIEALGMAYLFEQGQSETGIYQIQCRLEYEQGLA